MDNLDPHNCINGFRKRGLWFKEIIMEEKKQIGGNHYIKCGIMPTTYIRANNLDFFEGNIVKYITRHKDKGGAEDIKKVIHYAEMILEEVYGLKRTPIEAIPESTALSTEDLMKKGLSSRQAKALLSNDEVKGSCPC